MSPGMGWDTGWVLLAQPERVLAGVGTAACGILCPTPPHSPVCTYMYRLTILQPAHTPRAAPGHTLPLDALPADTYMSLHTHVCPYTALCHPTQSLCPTALPAPVSHQCTHHQCTPTTPQCLFSPCSLDHSHLCLLAEAGAPLPQPLLLHGPGAVGHRLLGREDTGQSHRISTGHCCERFGKM